MHPAYKLNKQGDNIQPWHTSFPIWNHYVVPCPVLTVASWPAYRFLNRKKVFGKEKLSSSRIHCCYIIPSTEFTLSCLLCIISFRLKEEEEEEKKKTIYESKSEECTGKKIICFFLQLENSRPISGLWEPQTPFCSLGNMDFLSSCLQIDCLSTKYMPPPWLIINLLTYQPAKHSSTLSLRNTQIGPTLAPPMPGEHTDHPTSILVMSPLRPPHINPCQVRTQTTPAPSMQVHHWDHPNSTDSRSVHRTPTSINARSPHRPSDLHPCQSAPKQSPAPSMPGHHSAQPTSIQQGQLTDHCITIPLTDKDKRFMEPSSWERLTVGEIGYFSDRRGHA